MGKNILITGNGFDLNLGLKTSYNDLIEFLKKQEIENSELAESKLDLFKNLKSNLIYQYFKTTKDIEKWIDFEAELENLINHIIKIFQNKSEFVVKIYISSYHSAFEIDGNQVYGLIDPNEEEKYKKFWSKFLKKYLENNLKKQAVNKLQVREINNLESSDFYFDDNRKNLKDGKNHKLNTNFLILIINELLQDLEEFKELMEYYFLNVIIPEINKITDFDTIMNITELIGYHFTFNYTPTNPSLHLFDKTKFLHGKIEEGNTKIVLGINDLEDGPFKKYFLPFTKYHQKLFLNTEYLFLDEILDYTNQYSYSIDYSQIKKIPNLRFIIFGHSIGESDKDYILEIFELLKINNIDPNRLMIICKDQISKSDILRNLLSMVEKKTIEKYMKNKQLQIIVNDSENITEITDLLTQ